MAGPFSACMATDADLAIKAPADFARLIPKAWRQVFGTDGTLSGFVLSSATVDFATAGITPGHVIVLEVTSPRPWQDMLGVASVSFPGGSGPWTVTLQRLNDEDDDIGPGAVPFPPANPVVFSAPSARGLLKRVSQRIMRRYGLASVDATINAGDFKDLCCVLALIDLLQSQHRAGEDEENFHVKYKDLIMERDTEYAALDVLYNQQVSEPSNVASFGPMLDDPTWRVPPSY